MKIATTGTLIIRKEQSGLCRRPHVIEHFGSDYQESTAINDYILTQRSTLMKTKLIPTLLWPKETVKSTEMLTVLTLNFVVRLLRKAFVFTGYACARSSVRSSEVLVSDEFGRS